MDTTIQALEPPKNQICEDEFKEIPGFGGVYRINRNGVILSKDRYYTRSINGGKPFKQLTKGKLMRGSINAAGYRVASISKVGQRGWFLVHRLVAETFIPKVEGKDFVNHINGIRHDNRVENLEWCTHGENIKHSFDVLGRIHPNIGVRGAVNPLSRPVICFNKGEMSFFFSIAEAARFLNVNDSHIVSTLKGYRSHVKGYEFVYPDSIGLSINIDKEAAIELYNKLNK